MFFRGVILDNKQDESKLTKRLKVALDIDVFPGSVVLWDDEHWIIYQKERRALQSFNVFYIVKCNYELSWIDDEGHLQKTWAYVVGGKDSKIKENFRTWNSLITPQPNRYIEILVPTVAIRRYTSFIINGEGWFVIDKDNISIKGITYYTMCEQKLNYVDDDLVNEIAKKDQLAKYEFLIPTSPVTINVGQCIAFYDLPYSIVKNGQVVADRSIFDIKMKSSDLSIVSLTNEEICGQSEGECNITLTGTLIGEIYMEPFTATYSIRVTPLKELAAYIEGNDTIKMDREQPYELKVDNVIDETVLWEVSNELVNIVSAIDGKCILRANNKNRLGTVTLTATYKHLVLTKEITVRALW